MKTKLFGPMRGATFVYFVEATNSHAIKIGMTRTSLLDRLDALRTANHEPLRMVGWMVAEPMTEALLHRRFRANRLRGEWFSPAPDLLDYIASVRLRRERLMVEWRRHEWFDAPWEVCAMILRGLRAKLPPELVAESTDVSLRVVEWLDLNEIAPIPGPEMSGADLRLTTLRARRASMRAT